MNVSLRTASVSLYHTAPTSTSAVIRWLQLRFDFDSTAVRFDCLSKVIKVTVTQHVTGRRPATHSHTELSMYEGRSINKLQNGAILLILRIGKIQNIRFVGNLILKIHRIFFDDNVVTVISSVHEAQSICVLFSPPVFYHNSQVINSIGTRKK